ncbi:putative oligopeptide transporter, OPT family [Noviherbaspirillum humi]|uniref:Putative oligopeptide transporter, OPT family n=1 Tax=Noviherbaspirillum humi TaxID=1688639 RepID=A0A239G6Y3_9BURK|nr:OPT family oligopeptide transporter [Noviherbaspirillum humi]SNS64841.1 putative oligopeptide transporter, OPT family [Noviherbaspirillum humi]
MFQQEKIGHGEAAVSHRRTGPVIERELSLRATLTGMLLGVLLTPSNVYAGLKIGWSFNMAIIALLIGFSFWQGMARRLWNGPEWTLHESNINQTVASAAASIISGGLVAPIPAYTLLTGNQLDPLPMMAWVFSVSFLGIWIAWYLRPSLINDSGLTFPEGMATLETLTHVYSHGAESARRLSVLFGAGLFSASVKAADTFIAAFPRWAPNAHWERLTFTFDPSLLLFGFGGIIGLRVGLSLLIGAALAWGGIAPWLLARHLVTLPADAAGPQFSLLVNWLLWPGVSLMACATLSSLSLRLLRQTKGNGASGNAGRAFRLPRPQPAPAIGLLLSIALVVTLQATLFGIDVVMALLTIPLALCLAAVAARVVGATGIPPIGAIGQLSQLSFGVVAPGQVAINLMSANTAGGAAGQCTDLMNDFKVGMLIGATPAKQVVAQCLGIAVGSIVGVLVYRALIPDPQAMLLSEQWPAPAAATWKAVAQTLALGLDSLSADIRLAILAGGIAGVLFGLLESALPSTRARLLPSPAALGLAFILPASVSLMMALGAIVTWLCGLRWPGLTERYAVTLAAGLVAGESMTGIGASIWQLARGGA